MSRDKEQSKDDSLLPTREEVESPVEGRTQKRRKKFVEPSVSSPVKVLEATRFLQGGSVGGGGDLLA